MKIVNYTPNSTVDGEGVRQVFWLSGCPHHCEGCHNPQTWDYQSGKEWSTGKVLVKALNSPFGVTFSGGEPFLQKKELSRLCRELIIYKTIWIYTGYTWEELIQDDLAKDVLAHIDVLVDGRFVKELRDENLLFRGSSNQRIIDVPRSLERGEVVLWKHGTNFVK